MLAFEKPICNDPLAYAQIGQNNGLLPIKFRLTAHLILNNWKAIQHVTCVFLYLGI